jgi:hypothetical protein
MRTQGVTTMLALALSCALLAAACGRPGATGLRDSFAEQLAANRFVQDFQRNGDGLTFVGPGPEGGMAKWRVTIDSVTIDAQDDAAHPYKGTIRSSWFADGQRIVATATEPGLPFELISNGLSQDCYALWNPTENRWSWE